MEHCFVKQSKQPKADAYEVLLKEIESMISCESDEVAVFANVASALHDTFPFLWTGFYIVRGEYLVLGPFQGSVACFRIKNGRGVCGTAWREKKTLLVPDVNSFEGHIACSSLSRSEIVVPIFRGKDVCAVLDIDSDKESFFDDTDKCYLEKLVALISNRIY